MTDQREAIRQMHEDIRAIFSAGLAAVDPHRRVKAVCRRTDDRLVVGDRDYDLSGYNGIYVIGAGKASAAMAAAIEDILGERLTGGLINVKYG